MASTQEILKAAQDLGKLVAAHETGKRLEAAVQKLQSDLEAQRLLNDFNRVGQKVAEKQNQGQSLTPEDKQRLETLQNQIIRHPVLRQFQMAQMDHLDLMRKIDDAINGAGPEEVAGITAPPVTGPELM